MTSSMDQTSSDRRTPLTGVKIVDLTTVVLGPLASRILADFGAEVIKVETMEGDSTRGYEPLRNKGMSGVFITLNRNKRSLALDLRTQEGRATLRTLIASSDVFMHNMRPGAIERLGFDYESVRALKSDIVYCGAYGFGANGPYRDKPAYDDLLQAGGGMASLVARRSGEPDYVPTVICDKLTAQAVAYAVLAALFQKASGRGGQAVEVPMFETAADFFSSEHMSGATFLPPLSDIGSKRILIPERRPFRTADGYACILPYSDRNWLDFYEFIGRTDLAEVPRYQKLAERFNHINELYEVIAEYSPRHTTAEWVEFCDRVSIPCMPVLDLAKLHEDPHMQAVGLYKEADHPSEGRYRYLRSPITFSGSDFELRRHAPRHGEQSREVLAEAGLSEDEINALIEKGIVKAPS